MSTNSLRWRRISDPLVIPTRAFGQGIDLSSCDAIRTLAYDTPGDGGWGDWLKVATLVIGSGSAAFTDLVGNKFQLLPREDGYDARAAGIKFDWDGDDDTATDNAGNLRSLIALAGRYFAGGYDQGGGLGNRILLPAGSGMFGSLVNVRDQVQILGKGPNATIYKAKATFPVADHYITLGDEPDSEGIAQTQTRGSAGNLVLNGVFVSGGIAYMPKPGPVAIGSASNNSGRTFTITGTTNSGEPKVQAIGGPNNSIVQSENFGTVTQIAVDGAITGTVTVGNVASAAFGSRLEDLQIFSPSLNALSGRAAVYSNKVQHTAGVKNLRIFGGNRHCVKFETGVGGAAVFVFEDIETMNHGNEAGVASNNSQVKIDYAGPLLAPIRNLVLAGVGVNGGAGAVGLQLSGGVCHVEHFHAEVIAIAILIDIPNINSGWATLEDITGGAQMTDTIKIDENVEANTVYVRGVSPNSATNAVNNRGTPVTGNILPWTMY